MTNPAFLAQMLAAGGDERIRVQPGGTTNRYGASPYPRATLGYSASTANDISQAAFAHLEGFVRGWPSGIALDARAYGDRLDAIRARLASVWGLERGTDIVVAPSGTDIEFAALALARARGGRPVTNVLLGADEVGSGCALAASGCHFSHATPVSGPVAPGARIAGLGDTELATVALRQANGRARDCDAITAEIALLAEAAIRAGRHVLVHAVHGSKTGLVLPSPAGIDALRTRFGAALTVVVDACQVRLGPDELAQWLGRGALVMLTGSKFVGGPPFSGLLLVPPALRPARALAAGLADVSLRAEWPPGWPQANQLPKGANPGLLLRLEAAMFEMERYSAFDAGRRADVIAAFGRAIAVLADRLGVPLVAPALAGGALHRSTLATLDLSELPGQPDLAMTQRWCRVLAARGLRLGQPVRWRRLADGAWAGNLRISLSMPLIVELAALDDTALDTRLMRDMGRIADVLEAAQRPVVA